MGAAAKIRGYGENFRLGRSSASNRNVQLRRPRLGFPSGPAPLCGAPSTHRVVRRPPTGMYTCAGHVWASRRTGLYETSDYETILNEDGYRTLRENELPRPGDLVLYRLEGPDEILHVGEIVEMCSLVPGGAPSIPRVLSKVDATSGEVLHAVENVPYDIVGGAPGGPPGRLRCRCEYRTDRPWEETR